MRGDGPRSMKSYIGQGLSPQFSFGLTLPSLLQALTPLHLQDQLQDKSAPSLRNGCLGDTHPWRHHVLALLIEGSVSLMQKERAQNC